MGNYRPQTPSQLLVFDDIFAEASPDDLQLLDEEFDNNSIDFSDPHQTELEITNPTKTHFND